MFSLFMNAAIASKTVKFAIGTFIPVVGGYLSDAADTVIGCSLLIKNAAGVIVLIGIIAVCLMPIMKIAAVVLLYKITCALVEPISEKRITDCINDIANSMILIIGSVAVVAFMFIVSITAIIGAGGQVVQVLAPGFELLNLPKRGGLSQRQSG